MMARFSIDRRTAGFTLIELVIAISIVGILAAIAFPSYSRYVVRANRAVARGVLVDLAAKQEVYKLQNQTYATDFSTIAGTPGTSYYINRSSVVEPASASDSIYSITMTATSTSFTLTAAPVGSAQSRDTDCTSLGLANTGLRSSSPKPVTTCWAQ